jgi:hypothetical protein
MAERIERPEDDFFTERIALCTAQFPTYYRRPQEVLGRVHTSQERYRGTRHEIIPIREQQGTRTYVLMHPYVQEPRLTLTVGVYNQPRQYADQESPIGEVIGTPHIEEFREAQVGNAQAWYYPTERAIVLWECFFEERFRKDPLPDDPNMQNLWQTFERYLLTKFPQASTLATPWNDPIADSIDDYQAFLKTLGYSPLAQGAFGKKVR